MNFKHGDARAGKITRLHKIWRKMLDRCNSKPEYAGRGISVCAEWKEYVNFRTWALSYGYSDDLTIERVNNDGNYEPSNCKWATIAEQTRNRRSSVLLEFNGERMTQSEWGRKLGIDPTTIHYRLKNGLSMEEVFAKPYHKVW